MHFSYLKKLIPYFTFACLLASFQLSAQTIDSCGEVPPAPEIINGENAALEMLIANSKDVNAFIVEADKYLDCQAGFKKKAKELPEEVQKQRDLEIKTLLELRNGIGDTFNTQVAAYRESNPE